MRLGRIDITKNYIRKRLKPPSKFDKRSFRMKRISKGRMLVVACPKSKWNRKTKRCKVGMQAQSLLTPRR